MLSRNFSIFLSFEIEKRSFNIHLSWLKYFIWELIFNKLGVFVVFFEVFCRISQRIFFHFFILNRSRKWNKLCRSWKIFLNPIRTRSFWLSFHIPREGNFYLKWVKEQPKKSVNWKFLNFFRKFMVFMVTMNHKKIYLFYCYTENFSHNSFSFLQNS